MSEFTEGLRLPDVVPNGHDDLSRSASTVKIAEALSGAQGEFAPALKGNTNPFFKAKYADLATMILATRKPLADHGIAVVQSPTLSRIGEPQVVTVRRGGEEREVVRVLCELRVHTMLLHVSGEWIAGVMRCVLPSADPQTVGSGTTYLRRYHYCAMVGIAPEDDDGESAMHRDAEPEPLKIGDGQYKHLTTLVEEAGGDWPAFFAFWHIKTLGDLPAKDYKRAVKVLEDEKAKKEAARAAGK